MSDGIYSNGSHVTWTESNVFSVDATGDEVKSWPPPDPFFDPERLKAVTLPRVKIDQHRTINAILVGDFTGVTHHLYRDEKRGRHEYRVLSAPMNIETDTMSYSAKLTDVYGTWNGWLILDEEGDVLTEGSFALPITGNGSDVALNFEAPRID